MNTADILQLVGGEIAQIDSGFEFWLVATFGVVVAIHAIRETILPRLKLMISLLYGALTLFALLETIGSLSQIEYLLSLIRDDQFDPEQLANLSAISSVILRLVIYVVGSISVLVFVFRYDQWFRRDGF